MENELPEFHNIRRFTDQYAPARGWGIRMTGAELKSFRVMVGLSQSELARVAGVHRNSIYYWEIKAKVSTDSSVVRRILGALDVTFSTPLASKSESGQQRVSRQDWFEWILAKQLMQKDAQISQRDSVARIRCDAKTRKGTNCRNLSEAGRRRCKFHGGMSTGPRTVEGRQRIAVAQRKRWDAIKLRN